MDYSYLSLLYVLNETEWPGKCFIRIEIHSIIKYPWMEVSEPRASHHTSGLLFLSNIVGDSRDTAGPGLSSAGPGC